MELNIKKILFIVIAIASAWTGYLSISHFYSKQAHSLAPVSEFQNLVLERSAKYRKNAEISDWVEMFERISRKYELEIFVNKSGQQQAEISMSEAPFDNVVEAFAELYSQGIRFQSIRLIQTDTPGMVRAETMRLIRSR